MVDGVFVIHITVFERLFLGRVPFRKGLAELQEILRIHLQEKLFLITRVISN